MSEQPAIPAATLVLVREPPEAAPQLLMVERAATMAFAGGALVFPGGRIDDQDRRLAARLGLGADGGARIAAIRETIEEAAVPVGLEPLPGPELAADLQRRLTAGEDFAELLRETEVELDPAALTPFAHWVPKQLVARRFDTLFFLARAPSGEWSPRVVGGECAGALWVGAAEALERERLGQAQLIFPTRRNLERLAQHRSFSAMLADARSHPVEPISPCVEERDGRRVLTIPAHLGYPVLEEPIDAE